MSGRVIIKGFMLTPTCKWIAASKGVSLLGGAEGVVLERRLGAQYPQVGVGDEARAPRLRGRHDPAIRLILQRDLLKWPRDAN